MEKNFKNSAKAAEPIKKIMEAAQELDIDYLESSLKDMRQNHNRRDSMMILNPNPMIHRETQELQSAKLKQLELIIELGKNVQEIKDKTLQLHAAKRNQDKLSGLFGH